MDTPLHLNSPTSSGRGKSSDFAFHCLESETRLGQNLNLADRTAPQSPGLRAPSVTRTRERQSLQPLYIGFLGALQLVISLEPDWKLGRLRG